MRNAIRSTPLLLIAAMALVTGAPAANAADPDKPPLPGPAMPPDSGGGEPEYGQVAPPQIIVPGGGGPSDAGLSEAAKPPLGDWPCQQRKVENISVSQVWDGPPIDGLKGWWEDKDMNELIEILISRKIPLADAEKSLVDYAKSVPADQRDQKLTLLFAGVFDKMGAQRRTVLSGLAKYLEGQRDRSADIETQGTTLAALQAKADSGDEKAKADLDAAQEKFDWASRIFQERQNTIPVACEVPVIIDQRLYEVARTIRGQMSK